MTLLHAFANAGILIELDQHGKQVGFLVKNNQKHYSRLLWPRARLDMATSVLSFIGFLVEYPTQIWNPHFHGPSPTSG